MQAANKNAEAVGSMQNQGRPECKNDIRCPEVLEDTELAFPHSAIPLQDSQGKSVLEGSGTFRTKQSLGSKWKEGLRLVLSELGSTKFSESGAARQTRSSWEACQTLIRCASRWAEKLASGCCQLGKGFFSCVCVCAVGLTAHLARFMCDDTMVLIVFSACRQGWWLTVRAAQPSSSARTAVDSCGLES